MSGRMFTYFHVCQDAFCSLLEPVPAQEFFDLPAETEQFRPSFEQGTTTNPMFQSGARGHSVALPLQRVWASAEYQGLP